MIMNKFFKFTALGLSIFLFSSSLLPLSSYSVSADSIISKEVNSNEVIVEVDGQTFHNVSVSEDILNAGQVLENYFYVDKVGNVNLKGSPEELAKALGISVDEAISFYQATKELPNIYDRGPVGFKFNLGPTVRAMNGWAAGAFATGYAGWYLKQFAVNPLTAGVVAVISGAIGWSVKTAVENLWTVAYATVDVPFVNLVYTIDLP
ncbi:TPA: hypothetical protein U1Y26_002238 [Streptococcus suis]|nr:hypothetical protein [Streptococcus suis]